MIDHNLYFLIFEISPEIFFFAERKNQNSSGTGSHPPAEYGLHLQILQNAKKPPLTAPKRLTAVSAYCEQLGVKRQERGNLSDNVILYSFISPIKIYFIHFIMIYYILLYC